MGGQGAARHHLVTEGAGEVLLWDFLQGCQPVLRAEAERPPWSQKVYTSVKILAFLPVL